MISKLNLDETTTDLREQLRTLLQEIHRQMSEYLNTLIHRTRTFSRYAGYWICKNILYSNVDIKRKRTGKRPRDYKTVSTGETEDDVP